MTIYELLKLTHVSCVLISGLSFVYRFGRLNRHGDRPLSRFLKISPHVNDTILLLAAIGMLQLTHINPFHTPWLMTKMVVLIGYIGAGAICLRATPGSRRQKVLFAMAMTAYAVIVTVALFKQVIPGS